MKQSNIKTPLVFRIGLVLLCVIMFSCYMMSSLYARYSTAVTGSATATVAKFDVTSDCVYDAESEKYILTIINNSEVSVSYEISYTVDGAALPSGITIIFEHGNSGTLVYGANISGELSFSENYTSYHEERIIDVTVTVTQID